MISIEEMEKILEMTSNSTTLIIFTIVGAWAIVKTVKMNQEVKKAIIREKDRNVQ